MLTSIEYLTGLHLIWLIKHAGEGEEEREGEGGRERDE